MEHLYIKHDYVKAQSTAYILRIPQQKQTNKMFELRRKISDRGRMCPMR